MKRYPKYYGGPHMDRDRVDGSLFGRPYLLGSVGGFRDQLVEKGIFFDLGVTQVLQGLVHGDSEDDANYVGSADAWLGLDTGRLGLWPGGLAFAHLEANWGDPVTRSGALLPVDADAIMPDGDPSSWALSELYLMQALSEKVQLTIGKADFAAFVDTTYFANNERTQFLNEGLVNNAVLGAFVPYTSLGAFVAFEPTQRLSLAAAVVENGSKATRSGFDELSASELTFAIGATYNTKLGGLPGSYQALLGYSNKDATDFNIDERYLLAEIEGLAPVREKTDNYAFALTASQYLWTEGRPEPRRRDGNVPGVGVFLRFGIGPKDRNVIDQFYSFGFGGFGGPLGRANDNWGIGWSGTHISGDLRGLGDDVGIGLEGFEHTFEVFYSFEVTPAVYWTLDFQYVRPIPEQREQIAVLGTRLQIDF